MADGGGTTTQLTGTSSTTGTGSCPGVDLTEVALGIGGFVIQGEVEDDFPVISVSTAGDVNGDGTVDLLVGASGMSPGAEEAGTTYVVFGPEDTTPVELAAVAVGTGGFAVHGQAARDWSGTRVSAAGDVDRDGLADVLVGARGADTNGTFSGTSYLVFGKTDGTPVQLLDVAAAGVGGFPMYGAIGQEQSGSAVAGAGDVNGDGVPDLLVGAPTASPNGNFSGAAYVVFGTSDTTPVELSNIAAGVGGFVVRGAVEQDVAGTSVSAAGDLNDDGLADVLLGAPDGVAPGPDRGGTTYVVFGTTATGAIELSDVESGVGGFAIHGIMDDRSGWSVSGAGDVNGDGVPDLLIGARETENSSGFAYVVFGKADTEPVELAEVAAGMGGFVIRPTADDALGRSVAHAGDLNGDGLGDLLLSASRTDLLSVEIDGAAYVVFGKTDSTPVELADVRTGVGGFAILGSGGERAGGLVSSAGDINRDGVPDLFLTAMGANPNGLYSAAVYVVFGGDFSCG